MSLHPAQAVHQPSPRRWLVLGLTAAFGAVLAGCGGGGSGSAATTTSTTVSAETTTTVPPTTATTIP